MKTIWIRNKYISILLCLMIILIVIPSFSALAVQQKNKSEKISKTKISKTELVDVVLYKGSVELTWKKTAGADGYQIFCTNEKNGKFIQQAKVNKSKKSYTINKVKEGIWYYKIRAYKKVGNKMYYGGFSDVKSISYKATESSSSEPTDTIQPDEKEKRMINITIGEKKFTTTLENNDTAKELVEHLPLKLTMSELNGNEKYNFLPNDLRADKSYCPQTIYAGDLMLYGDNCLVLFYKTFHTSYNYVKLGHIDDTNGLAEAVGSENVQVTFSVSGD